MDDFNKNSMNQNIKVFENKQKKIWKSSFMYPLHAFLSHGAF